MLEACQVVWGFYHSVKTGRGIIVHYDDLELEGFGYFVG